MVKRRVSRPLGAAVLLVLALGGLAACGDDTGGDGQSGQDGAGAARTHAPQPTNDAGAPCAYAAGGPVAKEGIDPPADKAAYSGAVDVTIETSVGDLGATLDAATAPCTVSSFTSLASQGYYDGTTCHRLTTENIFVLQCGDPEGTGGGGPGYSFADELSGQETYPAGTLAMANSGPDTNGSQFFIVYADTPLPPSYTVFGSVDAAAVETVAGVAADGVAGGGADGAPATAVDIDFVEVGEESDAPPASPTATATTAEPAGTCTYTSDGTGGAVDEPVDAPPAEPTVEGRVSAVITTNLGRIPVTLDADATPCTVASFVSLAEQGYYDGTTCHRLTTEGILVLQCGDPTGTGGGGPGYAFPDELTGSETYTAGTLAMANSGPDTNGSQFFIVYGESSLAPSYTVFGQVSPVGLRVVDKVAKAGVAGGGGDGAPKRAIRLTKVTVAG